MSIDPRQSMNDYSDELSLMVGMCAGRLKVEHGVGILRTLPPADEKALQKFDTAAAALGYERGERSVVGERCWPRCTLLRRRGWH